VRTIDIHTHGLGGKDTRTSDAEDILKMAELHGEAGTDAIIPTIYPAAIAVMRENMTAVKKAMVAQKTGAKILGINLEGPFLNPLRCGALDAASFLKPDERALMELIEGFGESIKIMTIAPELPGALTLIEKLSGMGIAVSMGHSDATYAEAEAGFRAGARGITHMFNAMRPFHHREPGIAGFGLMKKDVYIEVIGDPFHLNRKTIELIFKVKDPKRIILVSDSGPSAQTLPTGKPATDESGRLLYGSMPIASIVERLVGLGIERRLLERCVSENPRRLLSL